MKRSQRRHSDHKVRFSSPESHVNSHMGNQYIPKQAIKPATYDGSCSWLDYHAHFETCAEINRWNDAHKGLYLAVSHRGNAEGVPGNSPKGAKPDYRTLMRAPEKIFAPPSQTELYRVQMWEQR